MREIKFRGLYTSPNGVKTMVYGNFIKKTILDKTYYEIEHSDFDDFRNYTVDEKTIGEFTGLSDFNRKEIYEGDIVRFGNLTGKVKFSQQIPGWYIEYQQEPLRAIYTRRFNCTYGDGEIYMDNTVEVIGTIHESSQSL